MVDIEVEAVNASYVHIRCSASTSKEIADAFTFDVPNAGYMRGRTGKRYGGRAGGWDGKIRLFNQRNQFLPFGLCGKLQDFARNRNYSTNFIGKSIPRCSSLSADKIGDWINGLVLGGPTPGGIKLREDQYNGIHRAIKDRRRLLLSPTASGKSVIAYILAYHQRVWVPGSVGLIIVPRIQLGEQLFRDFSEYSKLGEWNTLGSDVQLIHGGQSKTVSKRVVISTWQSIFEFPPEFFERFSYVICDEVHEAKAKSISYIMNSCVNAYDRIGMTGTLDGIPTHKLMLEGMFGPVHRMSTSKQLMNKGAIAKLNPINCIVLKHPKEDCIKVRGATYEEEIQYLISSEKRNEFISKLALTLKGNTLILYQRVEKHGELLYKLLKTAKTNVHFVHGGVDIDDREAIRAITEKCDDSIIVASYGTFSTGINIRNLHNVIFASPSKSRIRVMQSIGRGLRIGDAKDQATLYDISDDLRASEGAGDNYTLKQVADRLEMYIEEKFPYKVFQVPLIMSKTGSTLYE